MAKINRPKKEYQWLYKKSSDPLLVGITYEHYVTPEELFKDFPELYGTIYGRCWWSERIRKD